MYNCGPTVYDRQHIGNLYSYIVADVLRRTLEYFGLGVKQVMNITDVGHIVDDADEGVDKMAVGAKRAGKAPREIADEYTRLFMEDRRRLNILDPQFVPKATDHIPEMIALIERLRHSAQCRAARAADRGCACRGEREQAASIGLRPVASGKARRPPAVGFSLGTR